MPRDIIIRSLSGLAVSVTAADLSLDAWPSTVLIRWDRIFCRDLDRSPTRIYILLKRGDEEYILEQEPKIAQARALSVEDPVYAPGDWRVTGRVEGATEGDQIELYAYGEVVEK